MKFVLSLAAICCIMLGVVTVFAAGTPGVDCQVIREDINQDCVVNSIDLSLVAQKWGPVPPLATPVPDTATPTPVNPATATPTPVSCWPTALPIGAVDGNPPPVFCSIAGTPPQTAISSSNSWTDNFDQSLSFTNLSPSYLQWEFGALNQTIQWQHANHWMVDINTTGPGGEGDGGWDVGGVTMRPNRSFTFEPRTWTSNHWGISNVTEPMVVVETDFAAGVVDYGGGAWGEIVITTGDAQQQTCSNTGCIYAYDHFPNNYTAGCRLHVDGFTCAGFYGGTSNNARQWEVSHFQNEGSAGLGQCGTYRASSTTLGNVCGPIGMRLCVGTNPDTACRDKIRMELSKTRLAVYVNGMLHGEWSLAGKPLPAAFTNSPVYVYLGSVDHKSGETETIRYHWDMFNVQP